MVLRDGNIKDIDNNLLKLYIEGFIVHYENRKDIFERQSIDDLRNKIIESLNSDEEKIIVIEDNNVIVGYLCYKIKRNSLWIDEIVVGEKYRNNGYGKILMKEIENIAKEKKCKRVELNCWSFNKNALKFYENLGYTQQRIVFEKNIY